MKINIDKIKVAERIRKKADKIDELAADIAQNGLLNAITVMPSGEEYQLLADLRRLRAVRSLGCTEIDVSVVTPKDAESQLRIEISENEQREAFTVSERLDYGRQLERIESAKALERKRAGKSPADLGFVGTQGQSEKTYGRTNEIVGSEVGLSRAVYQRAKYVAEHAPHEIAQIDSGEKSVTGVYNELRAKTKVTEQSPSTVPTPEKPKTKPVSAKVYATAQERLAETEVKRREIAAKCATAEHKRETLETQLHNVQLQWNCDREGKENTIAELRERVAELETALSAANARIKELEDKYER